MFEISDEKLNKLAKLARIEVGNDREKIKKLLNFDINGVKNIDNIDTNGFEAMVNPYQIFLNVQNDEVIDGNKQTEVIGCAPQSMYNYYIVPKVVE